MTMTAGSNRVDAMRGSHHTVIPHENETQRVVQVKPNSVQNKPGKNKDHNISPTYPAESLHVTTTRTDDLAHENNFDVPELLALQPSSPTPDQQVNMDLIESRQNKYTVETQARNPVKPTSPDIRETTTLRSEVEADSLRADVISVATTRTDVADDNVQPDVDLQTATLQSHGVGLEKSTSPNTQHSSNLANNVMNRTAIMTTIPSTIMITPHTHKELLSTVPRIGLWSQKELKRTIEELSVFASNPAVTPVNFLAALTKRELLVLREDPKFRMDFTNTEFITFLRGRLLRNQTEELATLDVTLALKMRQLSFKTCLITGTKLVDWAAFSLEVYNHYWSFMEHFYETTEGQSIDPVMEQNIANAYKKRIEFHVTSAVNIHLRTCQKHNGIRSLSECTTPKQIHTALECTAHEHEQHSSIIVATETIANDNDTEQQQTTKGKAKGGPQPAPRLATTDGSLPVGAVKSQRTYNGSKDIPPIGRSVVVQSGSSVDFDAKSLTGPLRSLHKALVSYNFSSTMLYNIELFCGPISARAFIDTGAQANLASYDFFQRLPEFLRRKVKPAALELTAANAQAIPLHGMLTTRFTIYPRINNVRIRQMFWLNVHITAASVDKEKVFDGHDILLSSQVLESTTHPLSVLIRSAAAGLARVKLSSSVETAPVVYYPQKEGKSTEMESTTETFPETTYLRTITTTPGLIILDSYMDLNDGLEVFHQNADRMAQERIELEQTGTVVQPPVDELFSEAIIDPTHQFQDHLQSLYSVLDKYKVACSAMPRKPTLFADIVLKDKYKATHIGHPRSLNALDKEVLKKQLDTWLADGIIEEASAHSEWAHGIVLVKQRKANGEVSTRVCMNPSGLNEASERDRYQMPNIEEALQDTAGYKVFSVWDMRQGYLAIGLKPEDKDKFTFLTPFGAYRFNRMAFGYVNGPALFQRHMERLLHDLIKQGVVCVYIDDVMIRTHDVKTHLEVTAKLLEIVVSNGFRISPKKAQILASEVTYLGQIIDGKSRRMDPKRLEPIKNLQEPRSLKEVQSFLSLCSYFRAHIPNLAEMLKPINDLNKKGNIIKNLWNSAHSHAFKIAVDAVLNGKTLILPDWNKEFVLETDASDFAMGAVLQQRDEQNILKPVAFYSRKFTDSESRYNTTEKEAAAIVEAFKKWTSYLHNAKTKVYSDHRNLSFLVNSTNPRVIRWRLFLQMFDYTIEHVPGTSNTTADALSRLDIRDPDTTTGQGNPILIRAITRAMRERQETPVEVSKGGRDANSNLDLNLNSTTTLSTSSTDVDEGHGDNSTENLSELSEEFLRRIYQAQQLAPAKEQAAWRLVNISPELNIWKIYDLIPIPREAIELKAEILRLAHEASMHGAAKRTKQQISQAKLTWKGINEDVEKHVHSCMNCQFVKSTSVENVHGHLSHVMPPSPFHTITVDYYGPIGGPDVKYKYLLVIVDNFSRWTELRACAVATGDTTLEVLRDTICNRHGIPTVIHSDNGTHFSNSAISKFCKDNGIHWQYAAVTHPQAVGVVERLNRVIGDALRIAVGNTYNKWHTHVAEIQNYINTSKNSSTGFSPHEIVYGFPARTLLQAKSGSSGPVFESFEELKLIIEKTRAQTEENILKAHQKRKEEYDKQRHVPKFLIGDRVLVYFSTLKHKLETHWKGPYKIRSQLDENTYMIEEENSLRTSKMHVSRMRKFDDTRTNNDDLARYKLPDEFGLVEKIITHRSTIPKGKKKPIYEFLVKWKNSSYMEWKSLEETRKLFIFKPYILDTPELISLVPRSANANLQNGAVLSKIQVRLP